LGSAVRILKKAQGNTTQSPTPSPSSSREEEDLYLEDITLGNSLGGGAFGEVFEGEWQGVVKVAVKKLHNREGLEEFLMEAKLLKSLRHPNVVSLFGIFMSPEKQPYIVTELMVLGNLRSLLAKQGPNVITLPHLLRAAKDTAAGMLYLSSYKIVHRDLAARNLLVKREGYGYVVKVADFGLSRKVDDHYDVTVSSKVPVRWTAPEGFKHGTFSSKSDVYSFGVVLYEIMTYGIEPWFGMSNAEVKEGILKGQQMQCPEGCPSFMYQLMLKCWNIVPEERPTFKNLFDELTKIEKDFVGVEEVKEERESDPIFNTEYASSGSYADASTYANSQ